MRIKVVILCIVLLNTVAVASTQRTARTAGLGTRAPWMVSVVHKINLIPTLRMNGIKASTIDGSTAFTFNLTSGIVLDHDGHILTRLVNVNPNNPSPDVTVKTTDGRTLTAEVLGLDDSTGLTILRVPDLKIDPPSFADDSDANDVDLVRILTPDFNETFNVTVTATVDNTGNTSTAVNGNGDLPFFPTMRVVATPA